LAQIQNYQSPVNAIHTVITHHRRIQPLEASRERRSLTEIQPSTNPISPHFHWLVTVVLEHSVPNLADADIRAKSNRGDVAVAKYYAEYRTVMDPFVAAAAVEGDVMEIAGNGIVFAIGMQANATRQA